MKDSIDCVTESIYYKDYSDDFQPCKYKDERGCVLMLERIDAMMSSTTATVITGAMFLAIALHTKVDVSGWIHTSWTAITTYYAGL